MDLEPRRCRRIDGKKWRCSKDVVPDQKYCERHMHRGRQRSRKPMEAPAIASRVARPTFNSGMESENSKTNLTIAAPLSLQLMSLSSNNTNTGNDTATTTTPNDNDIQRENDFRGNKRTPTAISCKERNYFNGEKDFNNTSLALSAVIKNEIVDDCGDNKDFRGCVKVSQEEIAFSRKKGERVNKGAVGV